MQKNSRSARYLRSSKDRHDVAIDAQRTTLQAIEAQHSLSCAAEFSDAIERADDWQRPGFVDLLRAISDPGRTWSTLVVLDSSRIARDDEYLGAYFRNECKKRGVRIVYGKLPSVNPMTDLIMQTVDQMLSRIHSMTSRDKGLAGMAANVRRGHRAGGRAPYGYELEHTATGAMREGKPVTKSRLVPTSQAPAIARYLKGRAKGMAGRPLARDCGLQISPSSLVGVEWNALTYAGNTVWNVHRAKIAAGDGNAKRRPRAEWIIQPATHEPLITQQEAEKILARLETRARARMRGADYLLSGILVTPAGRRWHGDSGFYRAGSRHVSAAALERAVLDKLVGDLGSDQFMRSCLERSRRLARPARREAELRSLQREARQLETKAARVRNLVGSMKHPEGMLRMLDDLEAERLELERQAAAIVAELAGAKVLTMITEEHVREVLHTLAGGLEAEDRDQVKQRIRALLEAIELDPERLTCRLSYAIPLESGDIVASPRGPEHNPTPRPAATLRANRDLQIPGRRRAA